MAQDEIRSFWPNLDVSTGNNTSNAPKVIHVSSTAKSTKTKTDTDSTKTVKSDWNGSPANFKPKERKEYWDFLLQRYRVNFKVDDNADGFVFSSTDRIIHVPSAFLHNKLLFLYALHELAHYVLGHEDTEDEEVSRNDDFAAWAWAIARMKEALTWQELQYALNNLDFPRIKAR